MQRFNLGTMSSFRRRLMMSQGGGSAEGIPSTEAIVGDITSGRSSSCECEK